MRDFKSSKVFHFLKDAWLGAALAFFAFYPYLSSLTSKANRMEVAWTPSDPWAIAFILAILGVLAAFVSAAAKNLKNKSLLHRLGALAFCLILWPSFENLALHFSTAGVGSWNLDFSAAGAAARIALIAAVLFLLAKKPSGLFRGLRLAILILSPGLLVFLGWTLTYKPVKTQSGSWPEAGRIDGNKTGPVIFLMFDEWSAPRLFQKGRVLDGFTQMGEIAKQADVYHRAFSPGETTNQSVPVYLGNPWIEKEDSWGALIKIGDSIFEEAKANGWRSAVLGAYLPYAEWFGGIAAFAYHAPNYRPPNASFMEKVLSHISLAQLRWVGFWNKALSEKKYEAAARFAQKKRVLWMAEKMDLLLEACGPGDFIYLHASLPHDPFLEPRESEEASYAGNMKRADAWIGRIKKRLEEKKLWDPALVLITSDHGWKFDPLLKPLRERGMSGAYLRHVPLVVKNPEQREGQNFVGNVLVEDAVKEIRRFLRGETSRLEVPARSDL